jgi:hypothetical protein
MDPSWQNAILSGSNSLGDARRTNLFATAPTLKSWAQAVGVASSPTTNVTSPVPMPDMSCVLKTTGNPIEISFSVDVYNSVAGNDNYTLIYVDGQFVPGTQRQSDQQVAGNAITVSNSVICPVAAGVHIVQVYWYVNSGTCTSRLTNRLLKAREIN